MNCLGFGNNSAVEMEAQLNRIETRIADVDKNLHDLMNQVKFDNATNGFAQYTATLKTCSSFISGYLTAPNQTEAVRQAARDSGPYQPAADAYLHQNVPDRDPQRQYGQDPWQDHGCLCVDGVVPDTGDLAFGGRPYGGNDATAVNHAMALFSDRITPQ